MLIAYKPIETAFLTVLLTTLITINFYVHAWLSFFMNAI